MKSMKMSGFLDYVHSKNDDNMTTKEDVMGCQCKSDDLTITKIIRILIAILIMLDILWSALITFWFVSGFWLVETSIKMDIETFGTDNLQSAKIGVEIIGMFYATVMLTCAIDVVVNLYLWMGISKNAPGMVKKWIIFTCILLLCSIFPMVLEGLSGHLLRTPSLVFFITVATRLLAFGVVLRHFRQIQTGLSTVDINSQCVTITVVEKPQFRMQPETYV